MNDDKKLEVIWVQPMREPQLIEIDNDLESMQDTCRRIYRRIYAVRR